MRFWQLFLRNLRETYRDPLALGALLAFPLIFMVVFGVALGSSEPPIYDVAVVDNDNSRISTSFINNTLASLPSLKINSVSSAEDALANIMSGDLHAFVVIQPGFGEAVDAIRAGLPANINVDLTYDESDAAILEGVFQAVSSALYEFSDVQIPVTINATPANNGKRMTQMDFIAPGIIIFGLLIMIPTSARIMTRDKENGCLSRLLTTPTRPWEFVLGYSLCLLLIAIIQIIIFLLLGWLMGMSIAGNLALAFLIFALTAIASIGIGMVVAALSKSANQAESLTWLFSMPLAALSGVWFSITFMPKYVQAVANIFPYAHAVEAARAVLLRGSGMTAVGGDVIFLAAWAAGVVLLGVFLLGRTMRY